ncbi:MAG: hypothetical protein U5K76_12580 [Woeseiaceae bacterium]|nr:hypothetical protein [Woeseiaceae bacterium]
MNRRERRRQRRKNRESFLARMRRRGRETRQLGRTLVNEPRAFPGECGRLLKRSFRTVWASHGGGYYACGFVVAFAWLEVTTFFREFGMSDGMVDFFSEQLLEFLLRFTVQSLVNTVQAFLWPLWFINRFEGWGIAMLIAGYLLFDRVLKLPLTRWLFDGDPDELAGHAADNSGDVTRQ